MAAFGDLIEVDEPGIRLLGPTPWSGPSADVAAGATIAPTASAESQALLRMCEALRVERSNGYRIP